MRRGLVASDEVAGLVAELGLGALDGGVHLGDRAVVHRDGEAVLGGVEGDVLHSGAWQKGVKASKPARPPRRPRAPCLRGKGMCITFIFQLTKSIK